MKRLLIIALAFVSTIAGAQSLLSPYRYDAGVPPAAVYIDSVGIDQIRTASTRSPKMYIGRTDEPVQLSASAYLADEFRPTTAFTWKIYNAITRELEVETTGLSTFITLDEGEYDVEITATNLNNFKRYFARGLLVEPPDFTEGEADLVIDLAAVQNDTYSPPGGLSITYDGGTNASIDFNDVVRPGFKIAVKNNFTGSNIDWIGLRGTVDDPVRIQNVGGVVTLTETGTSVLWQFGEGNQYITIDGGSDADVKGFRFIGKTTSGDQSQMMYFIGNFIKGIKIINVYFDQTRDVYGFSQGGACLQFSTVEAAGTPPTISASCNGNIGDPGYFTAEYFKVFNCTFFNTRDEGSYIGYFTDAAVSGYRPYRTGYVVIAYNTYRHHGRDPIQYSLSDSSVIIHNYMADNANEASTDHNSAISFNDGNRGDAYIAFNYADSIDNFCSLQNGGTGDGNYHFYSNVGIQRATALSSPTPQFFFSKMENTVAFHLEQFNNTWIANDVSTNAVAMQFDAPSTISDPNYKYAYNAMIVGGSDDSPYPELRDIGLPSSRPGWIVTNTFRRTASGAQLLLDADTHRPADKASPVYGAGEDLSTYNLYAGNYDIDGYSLLVDRGAAGIDYTAGAFSGFQKYVLPDVTPPVFTETSATNVLATSATLHAVADEAIYLYYVRLADGASAPSAAQVFAGQDASGSPAPASGNTTGDGLAITVDKLVTSLSSGTSYDFYVVAEDADGNQQTVATKIDVTTLSGGVQLVNAGTGASQTGTATALNIPYPASPQSGNLLIMIVAIKSASGDINDTQGSGWTLVTTESQIGSTDAGTHAVFWKISNGTESGNHTVAWTTDAAVARWGRMYQFSGTHQTVPFESIASARANNSTVSDVGVTSTVTQSMAVNSIVVNDDNTITDYSGQTGGTWIKAATEFTATTNNGVLECLMIAEMPSAGTINGGSATMSGADPFSIIGFIIKTP